MLMLSVYDAHGEMFEVRPDKAKELVIVHGWSLDPPSPQPHNTVQQTSAVDAPPSH